MFMEVISALSIFTFSKDRDDFSIFSDSYLHKVFFLIHMIFIVLSDNLKIQGHRDALSSKEKSINGLQQERFNF